MKWREEKRKLNIRACWASVFFLATARLNCVWALSIQLCMARELGHLRVERAPAHGAAPSCKLHSEESTGCLRERP